MHYSLMTANGTASARKRILLSCGLNEAQQLTKQATSSISNISACCRAAERSAKCDLSMTNIANIRCLSKQCYNINLMSTNLERNVNLSHDATRYYLLVRRHTSSPMYFSRETEAQFTMFYPENTQEVS